VGVAYSAPSDSPLRNAAGDKVSSFSGSTALVTTAVPDTEPPIFRKAEVYTGNPHEAWLFLTFDEALIGPAPLDSDFHITVNGERRSTRYSSALIHDGIVHVLLDSAVAAGDTVKVGYTRRTYRPTDHWAPLRDQAYNQVESFSDAPVSNRGGPPVVVSAEADGTRLSVTFNETLDARSVPAPGDFHVTVGASPRNVSAGGVAIDGATVALTLGSVVTRTDRVTVRYTRGTNPLRDLGGSEVASFADQAATNVTAGPRFASAAVDRKTLTVTFDEALDEGSTPAPGDFHVTVGSARRDVAAGGVAIDGAAVRLTLASAVGRADRVRVRYTKPTANPLRDPGGNEVASFTDRTVANGQPPSFQGAQVDGRTITLTFDEPLDRSSAPAPDDFFVIVGPDRRPVAPGGVAIDGATVRLTLSWPAATGETVTLSYKRYTNPLRDRDGNEVEDFAHTEQGVTNVTPPAGAFWSAVLTVKEFVDRFGCAFNAANVPCESALSDDSFTRGDTSHEVFSVDLTGSTGALDFVTNFTEISQDWTLHVGDQELAVADAEVVFDYHIRWANTGLTWAAGDKVALFLSAPAAAGDPGPAFESAEANGDTLTLTFDGTLDARSVPAPGDFYVSAGGIRRDVAEGGVAIDGATVTLTLDTWEVVYGQTVTVRYARGAKPLRGADGKEVASFAHTNQSVTNNTPQPPDHKIWSATLTAVTINATFNRAGCWNPAYTCSSALTEDSFTYEGISYRITGTSPYTNPNTKGHGLLLRLNKVIPSGLTLHVGEQTFSISDATLSNSDKTAEWANPGFHWTAGDKVQLALSASAAGGGTASSGPGFQSASISGRQLRITFDEPLDEDSTPDGDSFGIRTLPDGGGDGGRGRRAAQGQGGSSSGTGTASVEDRTVTVTLDRPVAPGERVFVSYAPPDENPVRDRQGGEAEGFSGRMAAHAPAVTAVAVVSDAGSDDTYALGETIRVRVAFAEKVSVDTSNGAPRLTIKMDPGWGEFRAAYAGGSGTKALTFTHTVAEPNTSPRGIAVLANTLELNGGAIRSAASGADADLTHTGLGHDAEHKVNWRITPSDVTAVAVVSDAGDDDTYALGDTIEVRVAFSGTVNVDTANGTPRLKIKMDPTWGEFWAAYAGGSGTASLTFSHTVAEPNTSPRGIAVLANTLQANGGAIRLAATSADARLGHTGLGHDPEHKVNWRIQPSEATAAAVVSDVWGHAAETANGFDHVLRWMRVLHTLGAIEGMTAAEAQGLAGQYWAVRWDPVVAEIAAMEAQDGYAPAPQVVSDVWGYAAETANGFDHVLRWMRVLATFGVVADMTSAEAQGYADTYTASRWDPVVAELAKLEASTSGP
jgi:uncharacterized repeat protein (TIGR02059 family)